MANAPRSRSSSRWNAFSERVGINGGEAAYFWHRVRTTRSTMKIDILTLFPEICRAPLSESMMKRAQENKIVDLRIHNLRDWTTDKHHIVDDAPFGGGQGMVMKPEPIFAAVEDLRNQASRVVLMSPAGHRFDQQMATQLSREPHV